MIFFKIIKEIVKFLLAMLLIPFAIVVMLVQFIYEKTLEELGYRPKTWWSNPLYGGGLESQSTPEKFYR